MLLVLPGAAWALFDTTMGLLADPAPVWPLMSGLVGYTIAWHFLFRRYWVGSAFSTLEHEITHSVFALLTFHPVTGMKTTWNQGGHMTFRGDGNWLIFIAPYFFPTLSVLVCLVRVFLAEDQMMWTNTILGATIAYHALSTWKETHLGQSDIQRVGVGFSFLFLPGANVLSYGFLLGAAVNGSAGVMQYSTDLVARTEQLWAMI
jgi:hypothetical protein